MRGALAVVPPKASRDGVGERGQASQGGGREVRDPEEFGYGLVVPVPLRHQRSGLAEAVRVPVRPSGRGPSSQATA